MKLNHVNKKTINANVRSTLYAVLRMAGGGHAE